MLIEMLLLNSFRSQVYRKAIYTIKVFFHKKMLFQPTMQKKSYAAKTSLQEQQAFSVALYAEQAFGTKCFSANHAEQNFCYKKLFRRIVRFFSSYLGRTRFWNKMFFHPIANHANKLLLQKALQKNSKVFQQLFLQNKVSEQNVL